jgi:dihydroorotate dehydrogenase (fumarate)
MTTDLATAYLGLDLRSPIVAGASPLNSDPAIARRLEAAGAAAIVLPSLFEEEILREELELDRALHQGTEHFAEALDYFPAFDSLLTAGDRYLAALEQVKRSVSIPVIASLNATTAGGWVRYARLIEEAGADALELNVYRVAADPETTAADIEAEDLALIRSVRTTTRIPLAVKLSPYYTSLARVGREALRAGADGLVLFNRFYQPDLDLDTLDVVPRVDLSESTELRLPLRWIAILRPQVGPGVSLAATTGIHTGTDAVKAIAVGADVAMVTSAVLRHGPQHLALIETQLRTWLEEREYASVAQLRGSASRATAHDPSAFERANYMRTLRSWASPPELEPASRHGPAVTLNQPGP